jgi:hypothetical protein
MSRLRRVSRYSHPGGLRLRAHTLPLRASGSSILRCQKCHFCRGKLGAPPSPARAPRSRVVVPDARRCPILRPRRGSRFVRVRAHACRSAFRRGNPVGPAIARNVCPVAAPEAHELHTAEEGARGWRACSNWLVTRRPSPGRGKGVGCGRGASSLTRDDLPKEAEGCSTVRRRPLERRDPTTTVLEAESHWKLRESAVGRENVEPTGRTLLHAGSSQGFG